MSQQRSGQPDLDRRLVRERLEGGAVLGLGGLAVGRLQSFASLIVISAGVGISRSRNARIADSDKTPTNESRTRPSTSPKTAGIERMPKAEATWGNSSVFAFTKRNFPSYSAASRSRIGPSVRHGPHHSAQKSITTGRSEDPSITSFSKVSCVVSMTFGVFVLINPSLPSRGRSKYDRSGLGLRQELWDQDSDVNHPTLAGRIPMLRFLV